VLRIGFIDADPAALISKNTIITDYLAKNLKSMSVTSVRIIVAASTDEMIKLINTGKVDIFIDTVYPIMIANKDAKLDVALRRWKKGVGEYKTLIITRKDSTLTDLKNLAEKKIGFEDPFSSSTRWIPQGMLMKAGYTLVEVEVEGTVPKNSIGYVYTGAVENMALWIMQGKLDVACVSSSDYPDIPAQMRNNFKIIAESKLYPRQLIAFSLGMDKKLAGAVKKIFLEMDKNDAGKEVLKKWDKTAKIDVVTEDMNKTLKEIDQTFASLKN
jgi:phosphonate transport system substrate-binding protein